MHPRCMLCVRACDTQQPVVLQRRERGRDKENERERHTNTQYPYAARGITSNRCERDQHSNIRTLSRVSWGATSDRCVHDESAMCPAHVEEIVVGQTSRQIALAPESVRGHNTRQTPTFRKEQKKESQNVKLRTSDEVYDTRAAVCDTNGV